MALERAERLFMENVWQQSIDEVLMQNVRSGLSHTILPDDIVEKIARMACLRKRAVDYHVGPVGPVGEYEYVHYPPPSTP